MGAASGWKPERALTKRTGRVQPASVNQAGTPEPSGSCISCVSWLFHCPFWGPVNPRTSGCRRITQRPRIGGRMEPNSSIPVTTLLATLRLGEPQRHGSTTVLPLFRPANGVLDFLTMDAAMGTGRFSVAEVSEAGSVPHLQTQNDTGRFVLLIDGEELHGAKQNRVLNTSLLIAPGTAPVIPVSCTEQGRWAARGAQFSPGTVVMAKEARSRKFCSVSASLLHHGTPASDQADVWQAVHALHGKLGSHSPTSAMHDAFAAHAARLEEALNHFPVQPGQHGVVFLAAGRVEGLDVVARDDAYRALHAKILRSYLVETLGPSTRPEKPPESAPERAAHNFIASIPPTFTGVFASTGVGEDHRFASPTLAGSALVHDHDVIHAAFLSKKNDAPSRPRHPLLNRRHIR